MNEWTEKHWPVPGSLSKDRNKQVEDEERVIILVKGQCDVTGGWRARDISLIIPAHENRPRHVGVHIRYTVHIVAIYGEFF